MRHIDIKVDACCGCGACEAICPTGAVRMQERELGFLYPTVQQDLCLECGKCIDVCQIGRDMENNPAEQSYYAGQHHSREIRMQSSSGGVFSALAQAVIQDQGIVYGACFDEEWKVCHVSAATMQGVSGMYGSKYIQSHNENVYQEIAKYLREGRTILYTGTPCQCQAILQYAKISGLDITHLYTIDFVCHGVGSPGVWKKYVEWLEGMYGKLLQFTFRDKENGWENFRQKAVLKNGTTIMESGRSYFKMYASLLLMRECCFACSYTSYERCSDLTLGDFWNISALTHHFEKESGVSQILTNTKKGKELLSKAAPNLSLLQCTAKDCWQPHLEYPVNVSPIQKKFLRYYKCHAFADVIKKYGKGSWAARCRKMAVSAVRKMKLYVIAGKAYKVVCQIGKKDV